MPVKEQGAHVWTSYLSKDKCGENSERCVHANTGSWKQVHQLLVLLLPLWLGGILDPALGIDLDYKHK